MARLAFSAVRAVSELAAMRVRLVAVGARCVRNRRFEIAAFVARYTRYREVFPNKRIVRLRVIELGGVRRVLPARGVVARLAGLLEFAFVRIAMTVTARLEAQACIARLTVRSRSVAALAQHGAMCAAQRISSLRVIESLLIEVCGGGFPINSRVTPRAILAEAPLVPVFMTTPATRRESHPRAAQVLASQKLFGCRRNVLCIVACAAHNSRVLAV